MSEILVVYPTVVQSSTGYAHDACAWGRERTDTRWEAWIEFVPRLGGTNLRTRSETSQPNRPSLFAWAKRLSRVYLEGALARATPCVAVGAPADAAERWRSPSTSESEIPEGVLDPFEVYTHSQSLLHRHLVALSVRHLRHIACAHEMLDARALDRLAKNELVDLIVTETERRAPQENERNERTIESSFRQSSASRHDPIYGDDARRFRLDPPRGGAP